MRIGIRAHDVKYAPLDELIPNIHNQGFHCMHIALSKSIKEFKPEISKMTPELLEQRLVPLTKNTSTNQQIILRRHLRHL